MNATLLQLGDSLVPKLYSTLICKILAFEIFHISLFVSIQLLSISILRGDESFKSKNLETLLIQWVWDEFQMKMNFRRKSWPKIVDKFRKLSKIYFSIECFTAEFFAIFKRICQKLPLGCRLGTCHQIETFHGYSWFPNCVTLSALSCSACHEAQLIH